LSQGAKGDDVMEEHSLRLHLKPALSTPEIRRAACAVEAIFRAADILDHEPPAVLEAVRDYCTDYNKGRKGTESEFKAAWIKLVVEHLESARQMERKFYTGITGEDWHTTGD
jgi:phytoene/squalene synthetase